MHRKIFFWAAILGALTVFIGAFGAHSLKDKLEPKYLEIYQTGVQYQFYHVIALFVTGLLYRAYRNTLISSAALCFALGIFFFSFSLYFLAITTLTTEGQEKWLNYLTPFGGFLFIAGWLLLAIYFVKEREKPKRKSKPIEE